MHQRTRLMTMMAILIAIGVLGSQFLWFPAGIAKAYPVQHAVNVIAAVMLGPIRATIIAFMIGLIRNVFGLGTLLAFPGGMIGALLAGYFYQKTNKLTWAAVGEAFGTGIIASLFAVPFAKLFMGTTLGALFFFPSFLTSSISGALIGLFIILRMKSTQQLKSFHLK